MLLQYLDVLIGLSVILGGVSLLVTMLVQVVIAGLGLRGSNLRWGLETLFENVKGSTLQGEGRALAEAVLRHPLVSDSTLSTKFAEWEGRAKGLRKWLGDELQHRGPLGRLTLAKALPPEELLPVLRDLARTGAGKSWHAPLVAALGKNDGSVAELVKRAGGVLPPSTVDAIASQVSAAFGVGQGIANELRAHFQSTMDRVTQRFVTHSRLFTIAISFPVAFCVQLDVSQIYLRLSADPKLRAELVAQAGQIVDESPLGAERERAQAALEAAREGNATLEKAELGGVATAAAARIWIRAELGGDPQAEEVLQKFEREMFTRNKTALRERYDELNASLGSLDLLSLGGVDAWRERWPDDERASWRHLLGILFGGALLSLGAPFWFNLLKTLMNLRPTLAGRDDERAGGRR